MGDNPRGKCLIKLTVRELDADLSADAQRPTPDYPTLVRLSNIGHDTVETQSESADESAQLDLSSAMDLLKAD